LSHSFNRTTTIAALDIGSSKACCIIAKIGRDKKINIIGYGYNGSKGIKNGIITDIEQATLSACNAVESAEQLANEIIDSVIINISGEKLKSNIKTSTISINCNKAISENEINKVIEKALQKIEKHDEDLIHCMPIGYKIDEGEEIKDPRNMFGDKLSVDILAGLIPSAPLKNLMTVIENSHLGIAGQAMSAYASGLACLVDDEKKIGATIIDIGGGTTSIATFKNGHPVNFSTIGVGGFNVTNDIAWGLTTSITHAERLKTLHGCAFLSNQDMTETLNVYPVGEEDDTNIKQIQRSDLIKIISPRIEETFELISKKLKEQGLDNIPNHRVVLTGGASQLPGMREIASLILDKQVRIGKPKNILGLPESLTNPAFSTSIGLLLFALNYSEKKSYDGPTKLKDGKSSFGKIFNWIKNNF
jgi:cell division protein FtsA